VFAAAIETTLLQEQCWGFNHQPCRGASWRPRWVLPVLFPFDHWVLARRQCAWGLCSVLAKPADHRCVGLKRQQVRPRAPLAMCIEHLNAVLITRGCSCARVGLYGRWPPPLFALPFAATAPQHSSHAPGCPYTACIRAPVSNQQVSVQASSGNGTLPWQSAMSEVRAHKGFAPQRLLLPLPPRLPLRPPSQTDRMPQLRTLPTTPPLPPHPPPKPNDRSRSARTSRPS